MGHNASDGSEGSEAKEGNDNMAQVKVEEQFENIEKSCRMQEISQFKSDIYRPNATPMCVVSV